MQHFEEFRRAAAALGDGNRLGILEILFHGPASVTALTTELGLRQPLVSHHLAVLADAGLVSCTKDGRRRVYEIANPERRGTSELLQAASTALADRATEPGIAEPAAGADGIRAGSHSEPVWEQPSDDHEVEEAPSGSGPGTASVPAPTPMESDPGPITDSAETDLEDFLL
ncbi:MAG: metalloregulator ArsR/SmtB family transcription factor [Candidatus Eisenbacteria bacterium]